MMFAGRLRFTNVARIVVVVSILLLIPLSTFHLPQNQMKIEGFDANLIDYPEGVQITEKTLSLEATSDFTPSITTITTPAAFVVDFTATVSEQVGIGRPLIITIWDPQTSDKFMVWFSSPKRTISYWATHGTSRIEYPVTVLNGSYSINRPYEIQISFFPKSHIRLFINGSSVAGTDISCDTIILLENATSILSRPMVNLDFSAISFEHSASSSGTIEKYSVTLPSQKGFNYFIDISDGSFVAAYFLLIGAILVLWRYEFSKAAKHTKFLFDRARQHLSSDKKEIKVFLTIIVVSFLFQILLANLGSHPYDIFTQKSWSYVLNQYGFGSLYPLPLISPSGRSVGTESVINLSYPYPPLFGYIYFPVGFVHKLLAPQNILSTHPFDLFNLLVKLPWIIATVLLGTIIYFYMKKVTNHNTALVLATLMLFNPGIVLDSAIWGQSEAALAVLICLSIIAIDLGSVQKMWVFLALSVLTKQTAIIAVAFISVLAVQTFGFVKVIKGLVFPFVLVFLIVCPWLIVGYSPSFLMNVTIGENVLNAVLGGSSGIASWQMPVSAGAHNIWPILNNQIGWSRFALSDSNQILGLSYARLGLYLTLSCFLLILLLTLFYHRKFPRLSSHYRFFALYLAIFSSTMFMTRMSPRYMIMCIPFLLLAFPLFRNRKCFILLFGFLTLSFSLSLYSSLTLTSFWQQNQLPLFYPHPNSINNLLVRFTTDNNYIISLSLLNIILFVLSMTFLVHMLFDKHCHEPNPKTCEKANSKNNTVMGDLRLPNCKKNARLFPVNSSSAPLVSIVVLNYNGQEVLRRCVLSILDSSYKTLELIVVDNASTDGSMKSIQDLCQDKRVKTIFLEKNLGFSQGNNKGASCALGKFLVFLNNDVEVTEDWLEELVTSLESNPKVGAVQPKLMFLDRPNSVQGAGSYVDQLGFTLPRTRLPEEELDNPCEIAANGAAFAIHRILFNSIGGFEPNFSYYYEDTDLSWRIYLTDRCVQYVPSSVVYHKEGASLGRFKLASRINLFVRNQLFTVFKNYSLRNGFASIVLLFMLYAVGAIWFAFRRSSDISVSLLKALFQFMGIFHECWKSHLFVQRQVRKISDDQLKHRFLKPFNLFLLLRFYRTGMGYTFVDYSPLPQGACALYG